MARNRKLPVSYYQQDDVVQLARSFLGKYLMTNIGGIITGGIITETEAYAGITDRASHAYNGLRSKRTETMYREGGISYIYLCYGMHHLFNIVTNKKDIPHAILVRGIFPVFGIEKMQQRTGKNISGYDLTNGPGKLTKALGITTKLNGTPLTGHTIWIEDRSITYHDSDISSGPRIGVAYAKEDALLPYRFVLDYRNYIS
jgi:DNA-3-methyladenine glycosylase